MQCMSAIIACSCPNTGRRAATNGKRRTGTGCSTRSRLAAVILAEYALAARKIKDTRDKDFQLTNDKGVTVNRWESYFQLGTSQMDNEECSVTHQMCRALGGIYIDHQARV